LFGAWAGHWAKGRILDIGTWIPVYQPACWPEKHPQIQDRTAELEILQDRSGTRHRKRKQASPFSKPNFGAYFIACNPTCLPKNMISSSAILLFFHQHWAAEKQDLQAAMHDDLLNPQDVAAGIHRLLKPQGQFAVIYPPLAMEKFEMACEALGFYLHHKAFGFSSGKLTRFTDNGDRKLGT
jgi:hypothetical protein